MRNTSKSNVMELEEILSLQSCGFPVLYKNISPNYMMRSSDEEEEKQLHVSFLEINSKISIYSKKKISILVFSFY